MKTVLFTIAPCAGDLLIVQYRSARGGRTHVMHRIAPGETAKDVSEVLAAAITREWPPEAFQAKAQNGQLVINCTGLVQDVTFSHDIEGTGGTLVTIQEF